MFIQTEITPNPNSLKFFPGKKVSNDTPLEVTDKKMTNNELVRNILSINGVTGVFLAGDFFLSPTFFLVLAFVVFFVTFFVVAFF